MKILTLGNYPMIKKYHPLDDKMNYGYLILSDSLSDKQLDFILSIESQFHNEIGLDTVNTESLKKLIIGIKPYITGANFSDWESYLNHFIEEF